jgi:AraC-like DNA-binding protein
MVRIKHEKPRGILNVRASAPAHTLARYWPSDDLSPFVEHYWIVRWDVPEPQRVETLPHPSVHMVLAPGHSEVVGVMRGKFTRLLEGKGRVVGTKFRPGAFRAFVDRPVASYTDRRWTLGTVFGPRADALESRVFAGVEDAPAIEIIEAFLRSLHPASDETMRLVGDVAMRIAEDRDITRVDQIAGVYAMTVRQLQRLFREYAGVTPKWVIQRYRLIEAAERLAAGASPDLAALAVDLGYADQPHFIRDFKMIVGRAPGDYRESLNA